MSLCSRCPDSMGGGAWIQDPGRVMGQQRQPAPGGRVTCTPCLPTPPVLVLGGGAEWKGVCASS